MQDNKNENNPVEDGIKFNKRNDAPGFKIYPIRPRRKKNNPLRISESDSTASKIKVHKKNSNKSNVKQCGDKDAKNNGSASNSEVESTDGSKSTPFKRPPLKRNSSVQKWSAITRTKVFSPQESFDHDWKDDVPERSNRASFVEDVNQVF